MKRWKKSETIALLREYHSGEEFDRIIVATN
jgi:hypothetical protein